MSPPVRRRSPAPSSAGPTTSTAAATAEEGGEAAPGILALAFNTPADLPFLAVGDACGRTLVYELAAELWRPRDGEREVLERLLAALDDVA